MKYRAILSITGFIAIVLLFIAACFCYVTLESDQLMISLTFIATTLSTVVIIIAALIMRDDTSASKRYEERYGKDKMD